MRRLLLTPPAHCFEHPDQFNHGPHLASEKDCISPDLLKRNFPKFKFEFIFSTQRIIDDV